MTEFLFIRHGETDWNRQQRFQGHIDVPLNPTGHAQAERLAARLAAAPADAVYSSDLLRARQTAAPLARAWGRPVTPVPALREQGFGVLEGLELAAVASLEPELWAAWTARRADYALPGGESVRDFSARVLDAVARLATDHDGGRIAVVTHGGVLDMLWRHARGEPLDGARACLIPNTGVNRLRWREGSLVVEAWGDDAHLAGLPQTAPAAPLAR